WITRRRHLFGDVDRDQRLLRRPGPGRAGQCDLQGAVVEDGLDVVVGHFRGECDVAQEVTPGSWGDAVAGLVDRLWTLRAGDGEVLCGEDDVDVLRPHPHQVAVDDQVLSTGEDVRGGPPEFHTTEGAVQADGARCVGDPIHLTDEGPCSVEKFADTSPV